MLNGEEVQVILLRGLVPFPNTSAECRSPVARGNGLAILGESLGLSPDVPVSLGVVLGGTGFLEPFVLVRGAEKACTLANCIQPGRNEDRLTG